jgi:hypothetical protein
MNSSAPTRDYLPLSKDVLPAHLPGDVHVGLYPLLEGDLCWWLAAGFDSPMAMLDGAVAMYWVRHRRSYARRAGR